MNYRKRQTIHLSMEKDDVILMSQMKDELGLKSFAEVQAWLLNEYRHHIKLLQGPTDAKDQTTHQE